MSEIETKTLAESLRDRNATIDEVLGILESMEFRLLSAQEDNNKLQEDKEYYKQKCKEYYYGVEFSFCLCNCGVGYGQPVDMRQIERIAMIMGATYDEIESGVFRFKRIISPREAIAEIQRQMTNEFGKLLNNPGDEMIGLQKIPVNEFLSYEDNGDDIS